MDNALTPFLFGSFSRSCFFFWFGLQRAWSRELGRRKRAALQPPKTASCYGRHVHFVLRDIPLCPPPSHPRRALPCLPLRFFPAARQAASTCFLPLLFPFPCHIGHVPAHTTAAEKDTQRARLSNEMSRISTATDTGGDCARWLGSPIGGWINVKAVACMADGRAGRWVDSGKKTARGVRIYTTSYPTTFLCIGS